ncbi:thioesterase [Paraflavitalea soli]|uniref:Thioesterase n=1 Tax=Paraflavitalea soli TaxID=2315862 RepID=A0A3B7MK94_9BACT|nr:alpha/beta fold hydrolase [Paraflavitalea soli]AXY73679.1 thioesterase [Paraflavitalea soli]
MSFNLLCLPFAGGNKFSYRKYEEKAPANLRIIPLEYPGRGSRGREPLLPELNLLVEDIYHQASPYIAQGGYAIYGHSLGALVAMQLARKIISHHQPPPLHLFVSGAAGPSSLCFRQKQRHRLERNTFIAEITRFDGSPQEILQNEEFIDYIEPVLRADFRAVETYQHEETAPLMLPVTVINGTEDTEIERLDISLWQKETNYPVEFVSMPGNHFFIFDAPAQITRLMANKLQLTVKQDNHSAQ